jgi:uncharacterized LabA/DUF88 family protein
MERVIAYIDGFNLYFGLKTKNWQRYYWLDVKRLAQKLLKPDQTLVATKYFTARVSATRQDPDKAKRQNTYLEALGALQQTEVVFGHYLTKPMRCHNCSSSWYTHEEKMTDVNIAVELLTDAFDNNLDTALIISGDSDLSRAIQAMLTRFPEKKVCVAFPPERVSQHLKAIASAYIRIGRRTLAASQLPETTKSLSGHILTRPSRWR